MSTQTMTETAVADEAVTVAAEENTKLVLAAQTEKPGPMTPALAAIQASIDQAQEREENPEPIAGLVFNDRVQFFKCHRKTGKWFEMDSYALRVHDAEMVAQYVGRTTLVYVNFHAISCTAYNGGGCGRAGIATDRQSGNKAVIGYASGNVMTAGEIHKDAQMYAIRYDRERQVFLVDGMPVTGAHALILGDDCNAVVIGPRWR